MTMPRSPSRSYSHRRNSPSRRTTRVRTTRRVASSSREHCREDDSVKRHTDRDVKPGDWSQEDEELANTSDIVADVNGEVGKAMKMIFHGIATTALKANVRERAKFTQLGLKKHLENYPELRNGLLIAEAIYILYQSLPKQTSNLKNWYRKNAGFCLKIPRRSEIWEPAVAFIHEQLPPTSRAVGIVKTKKDIRNDRVDRLWDYRQSADEDDLESKEKTVSSAEALSIVYDLEDNDGHTFKYQGDRFWAIKDKDDESLIVWHKDCRGKILSMLASVREAAEEEKNVTRIEVLCAAINGKEVAWVGRTQIKRRSLECLCLDPKIKKELFEELRSYLHPKASSWYSSRGQPHRRGYLLYGPGGCGKTSLIQIVSGHYRLTIHELRISDPGMTDEILATLFAKLSVGDVIVLEDIDCAGITTQRQSQQEQFGIIEKEATTGNSDDGHEEPGVESESSSDMSYESRPRQTKRREAHMRRQVNPNGKKNGTTQKGTTFPSLAPSTVTLSGLLNAIDGIGSPEGHLLFMTSNHPENLDKALKRARRIDRVIKLDYAQGIQIEDLSCVIYTPKPYEATPAYDPDSIPALAKVFAKRIPDRAFTPAEIMDHLMRFPDHPHQSIDTVSELIEDNKQELLLRNINVEELQTSDVLNSTETDSLLRLHVTDTAESSKYTNAHSIPSTSEVSDTTTRAQCEDATTQTEPESSIGGEENPSSIAPSVAQSGMNDSILLFTEPQPGEFSGRSSLQVTRTTPALIYSCSSSNLSNKSSANQLQPKRKSWLDWAVDALLNYWPEPDRSYL